MGALHFDDFVCGIWAVLRACSGAVVGYTVFLYRRMRVLMSGVMGCMDHCDNTARLEARPVVLYLRWIQVPCFCLLDSRSIIRFIQRYYIDLIITSHHQNCP